jgi:ribosome-associated protein
MEKTIHIHRDVIIPLRKLRFKFSRSGGKGGQNVNKVETKVELLFDVGNSSVLTPTQKELIRHRLRSHIDDDGIIHLEVQESRSQWQNREIALRKFTALLEQSLRPIKKRIKTSVPVSSQHERLVVKKRRSRILKSRDVEPDY